MTTTHHILLSAEQQEQVKNNLAKILKEAFSIDNQSEGKLVYLTARLMGFDNHHQRSALLKQQQEKTAKFQALLQMPAELIRLESQWPAGVLSDHNGEIPDEAFERLKARGWFDQETGYGYRDLEIEFRYESADARQEPSFNLRLCIDDNDKCVHFIIGDNLGDGFNEHVAATVSDFAQASDRASWINTVSALKGTHRSSRAAIKFAEAFEAHPETANVLLDEIEVITRYLSTGELPAAR